MPTHGTPSREMGSITDITEGGDCLAKPDLPRLVSHGNDAEICASAERDCSGLDPPVAMGPLGTKEHAQQVWQNHQPSTEMFCDVSSSPMVKQLCSNEKKAQGAIRDYIPAGEEFVQRHFQESQYQTSTANSERDTEALNSLVKSCLDALADEIVNSRWSEGKDVTKDTSPKFAADVLVQIRQRYYAHGPSEDWSQCCDSGFKEIHPDGRPCLTLENMKWVFDHKVRPLTDQFYKELFLCNGCDGNTRFYGFEGVVQHFAAKHTTQFSMGNVVVHWRAEWPEDPPFNPNPSLARATNYKAPISESATTTNVASSEDTHLGGIHHQDFMDKARNTARPTSSGGMGVQWAHHLNMPRNLGPESLSINVMDNRAPVEDLATTATHSLPTVPETTAAIDPFLPGSEWHLAGGYGSPPSHSSAPIVIHRPAPSHFSQLQANLTQSDRQSKPIVPVNYSNVFSPSFQPRHSSSGPRLAGAFEHSDLYMRQLEDMARHAKDAFCSLGNVKEMPGSVRIFVTIQHTVSRFQATYVNEPSLSMFIDGLDRNATMRPVRSVNGLACKACVISRSALDTGDSGNRRLFTLPHLVNHFRTAHEQATLLTGSVRAEKLPFSDWKFDMIELPDVSIISNLAIASGMTTAKIKLIRAVIPGAFTSAQAGAGTGAAADVNVLEATQASPTSEVGLVRTLSLSSHGDCSFGHHPSDPQQLHNQPLAQSTGELDHMPPQEVSESPGEDEYDPRRPAVLQRAFKLDLTDQLRDQQPLIQGRLVHSKDRIPLSSLPDLASQKEAYTVGLRGTTGGQGHLPVDSSVSADTHVFEEQMNYRKPSDTYVDNPENTRPRSKHHNIFATGEENRSRDSSVEQVLLPRSELGLAEDRENDNLARATSSSQMPMEGKGRPLQNQSRISDEALNYRRLHHDRHAPIIDMSDSNAWQLDINTSKAYDPRHEERFVASDQIALQHESHQHNDARHGFSSSPPHWPTAPGPVKMRKSQSYTGLEKHKNLKSYRRPQDKSTSLRQLVLTRPLHRGGSRSPAHEMSEGQLYRTRSPIEEDRGLSRLPIERLSGQEYDTAFKYDLAHPEYRMQDRYETIRSRDVLSSDHVRTQQFPNRTEDRLPMTATHERVCYFIDEPNDHVGNRENARYKFA